MRMSRTVEALERRVLSLALAWHRAVSASEKARAVDAAPVHDRANAAEDALRRAVATLAEAMGNQPS